VSRFYPRKSKVSKKKREEFYESRDWYILRAAAIEAHGRTCLACGQSAPDVIIQVDHIRPISIFWANRFDLDNLQVLCKQCNIGKSNISIKDWRVIHPPEEEVKRLRDFFFNRSMDIYDKESDDSCEIDLADKEESFDSKSFGTKEEVEEYQKGFFAGLMDLLDD
jgi:hypothetical protein